MKNSFGGFPVEDSLREIPFEGNSHLSSGMFMFVLSSFLFSVLVFISFPDLIDFEIL